MQVMIKFCLKLRIKNAFMYVYPDKSSHKSGTDKIYVPVRKVNTKCCSSPLHCIPNTFWWPCLVLTIIKNLKIIKGVFSRHRPGKKKLSEGLLYLVETQYKSPGYIILILHHKNVPTIYFKVTLQKLYSIM